MRPGFLLAAGLAATAAAPAARASLVMALDLPGLVAQADRIVVAEVLEVRSAWDAGHRRILSTIQLSVAESWKGGSPGGRLTLVQPGGTADGTEMIVHGLPRFHAGERAVLFLRGSQPRTM